MQRAAGKLDSPRDFSRALCLHCCMRYRLRDFELDLDAGHLTGPAGVVPLRRQVLMTLRHLIERAPDLVSQDELLDAVWGRQAISPSAVPQAVRELRRAFGDDVREPRYIETRHRLGYRLIAPVVVLDADEPTQAAAAATATPSLSADRAARSAWRAAFVACAVLAIVIVAALLLPRRASVADAPAVLADGLPHDAEARQAFRAALIARENGNLADAELKLKDALVREPDAVASLAERARVLAEQGRIADARREATHAIELAGDLPRGARLRLDALDAELAFDRAKAAGLYRAVFEYDPGDAAIAYRLFDAELALGDRHNAAGTLDAIAKIDDAPDADPTLAIARARLAAANGDPKRQRDLAQAVLKRCAGANACPRAETDAHYQLAVALRTLGRADDARREAAAAAAHADAGGYVGAAAAAVELEGVIEREQGQLDAALATIGEAQRRFMLIGDEPHALEAARELAVVERIHGDMKAALARLDSVERRETALGDDRGRAATLLARGMIEVPAGDLDGARASLEQARDFFVALKDPIGEAAAELNLGGLYGRLERHAEAGEASQRALVLFRQLADKRGQAIALSNLAVIAAVDGKEERQRELNEEALVLLREIGARLEVGRIQFNLGVQDRQSGRIADAEKRFREALDAFVAGDALAYRQRAAASLANLEIERGDLAAAEHVLAEAPLGASGGDPLNAAALQSAAGRLAELRGTFEVARAAYRSARELREKAAVDAWIAMSDLDLARLDLLEGELTRAEVAARRLTQRITDPRDAAAAEILLAETLVARKRNEEAARLLGESTAAHLAKSPDAALALESELVLALAEGAERERIALARAAAERQGFGLLAIRARLAETDDAAAPPDLAEAIASRGLDAWAGRMRDLFGGTR
jgi:DNA-binding winged helix-turn-helix (wHTH) protein